MQNPIYLDGIHSCFNCNIEILRDVAETIGTREMSNAYGNLSFAITDCGRIIVMIEDCKRNSNKKVCAEYQGDGCVTVWQTDAYGNPVEIGKYELFDSHSHIGHDVKEAFHKFLKDKFDITI